MFSSAFSIFPRERPCYAWNRTVCITDARTERCNESFSIRITRTFDVKGAFPTAQTGGYVFPAFSSCVHRCWTNICRNVERFFALLRSCCSFCWMLVTFRLVSIFKPIQVEDFLLETFCGNVDFSQFDPGLKFVAAKRSFKKFQRLFANCVKNHAWETTSVYLISSTRLLLYKWTIRESSTLSVICKVLWSVKTVRCCDVLIFQ